MITINKDKDKDYYGKDKDNRDENKVVKELTDSPMPQDLLHAPHGPQPVTWQFRGSGNAKICDKFASENIFSSVLLFFLFLFLERSLLFFLCLSSKLLEVFCVS